MVRKKNIKDRGKIRFSEYFKKLNNGDRVAIIRERAVNANFPERIQGLTGEIINKRGTEYVVKIKELNMEKQFIVHPIHLKRLK
jgi:ribosomal protein L21E